MNFHHLGKPRHLVLALGDQLNLDSAAFDGFDPPFTPSFLRRNEVMVRVQEDAVER